MRRLYVLAIAALTVALVAPPAVHAEQDGCVAIGTHAFVPPQPWSCRYVATGPGYFVAATPNPFIISADRTGVPGRVILYSRGAPGRPMTGKIDSKPGDIVWVSISCWDYLEMEPCSPQSIAGGRDGTLAAQSFI